MNKYTGVFIAIPKDLNGGITYIIGKSEKGRLRDHRKGRCLWLCGYCMDESECGSNHNPYRTWKVKRR